jgi:hypothetical protein
MSCLRGLQDEVMPGLRNAQPHSANARVAIASSIGFAFSMMGEDVRKTLLFHIQNESGLVEEELPSNPERLGEALAAILGNGARVIESKVVGVLAADPSAGLDSANFALTMTTAISVHLTTVMGRGEKRHV